MPLHTHLTASAERSLNRAAQFAIADGSDRVGASHMLWALWLEESNASAVLQSLGVQREQVELSDVAAMTQDASYDAGLTTDVIIEARQFLPRVDTQAGELTSEHLLLGLTTLAPKQLASMGLTADRIEELLIPVEDTTALPVGDEFRLREEPSETPVSLDGSCGDTNTAHASQSPVFCSELDVYRTIDAAANRAREGLRVVEDLIRFSLSDRFLTQQLKSARHELSSALSSLDPMQLIRARDTQRDTGTTITVRTEHQREGQFEILLANMKRCQEALRTLEEMTKATSGRDSAAQASACIEQVRYRSYTIEKAIATTMNSNRVFADRCLYLLVTESLCASDWRDVVMDAISGGIDVIQLREKKLPDLELVRRGKWLRERTAANDVLFIMNDRPDLAAKVRADGVHVGQEELSVQEARRILGPAALVGVSTHNIDQARQAVLDGADYLGVGPVFPTKTKSFEDYAGLDYVKEIAKETTLPWFAIGGINKTNLDEVRSCGAQRVAVSSAICTSRRLCEDTTDLAASLRR